MDATVPEDDAVGDDEDDQDEETYDDLDADIPSDDEPERRPEYPLRRIGRGRKRIMLKRRRR